MVPLELCRLDVPLIFCCPADHVPDWQLRILLSMVEARSVNVKNTPLGDVQKVYTRSDVLVWFDGTIIEISTILSTMYYSVYVLLWLVALHGD